MAESKWKESYLVTVLELAREEGLSNNQIALKIGVTASTFQNWVRKKPSLRKALNSGRKQRKFKKTKKVKKEQILKQLETLPEYVYKRLDPEVQKYWDKLQEFEKSGSGIEKIEYLLERGGKYVRQSIFIHALLVHNFKVSHALRKANISRNTLQNWKKDPQFCQLMMDIEWYKGNFIEDALMDLIKMRDTSAVIHASKTYNRSRGYSEKLEIEGTIVQHDNPFDKLPLKLRKQIREELRKQE